VNELDRMIQESLQRRASAVPAAPKSYGDVNRRIIRRRRRGATMATAAVTVPALAAIGWAVSRPEPIRTALGPADGVDDPMFQTTSTGPGAGQYRCTGQVGGDGAWTYYDYCEMTSLGVQATFAPDTVEPTTTIVFDAAGMADHVLFVDGSGGLDFRSDLTARLGVTPRYELPATRVVEQTMVMPTGADVSIAYSVLNGLGIGGFDTWTPDLIGGDLPDGISVVVVVGADWFTRVAMTGCTPATTTVPPTTTSTSVPSDGAVVTTTYPPPTTTTFIGC
jgi:hypothetical protein